MGLTEKRVGLTGCHWRRCSVITTSSLSGVTEISPIILTGFPATSSPVIGCPVGGLRHWRRAIE